MKFTTNLTHKSSNKSCCCCGIVLGWHPRILALLITVALGLSIVSSLDCRYIIVDLGFTPQRYFDDELAFGLWAYSAPGGRCLSYSESRQIGLFSEGDMTYASLLMNGDINWTIARILALVGVAFGSIALLSILYNLCKQEPHLVDIISYTTITAFLSECSKFGLFLGTDICTAEEYWYSDISEEFSGSKSCKIGMGGYLSIGSFAAYFISMILAISNFTTAPQTDYTHGEEDSLPSWMLDADGTIIPNAKKPPENKVPDYNRSNNWSTQSDSLVASKRNLNNYNQNNNQNNNQRLHSSRTGPSPAERHRNMQSSFNQSDSRMHRRVGSRDSNVHSSFNSDDQRLHDSKAGPQDHQNMYSNFNQSNQRLRSSGTGRSPDRNNNVQASFNQSDSRLYRSSRSGARDDRNVNSSFNSDDQKLYDSRRSGPYNVNSSFNKSELYDSRTGNEQYQQVEDYAIDEMIEEGGEYEDELGDLPEFQGYSNPPPQDDEVSEMTWDMAY